jgi:hypothetical protein
MTGVGVGFDRDPGLNTIVFRGKNRAYFNTCTLSVYFTAFME